MYSQRCTHKPLLSASFKTLSKTLMTSNWCKLQFYHTCTCKINILSYNQRKYFIFAVTLFALTFLFSCLFKVTQIKIRQTFLNRFKSWICVEEISNKGKIQTRISFHYILRKETNMYIIIDLDQLSSTGCYQMNSIQIQKVHENMYFISLKERKVPFLNGIYMYMYFHNFIIERF